MASWKKVIVSGSIAELAVVSASSGILVGTNQQIGTTQATTFLSGSFTGSFTGDINATINTATSASFVQVTDTTSGTGPYYLTFVDATSNFPAQRVDSNGLTYNATNNALTASIFTGSFSGSLEGTASWARSASNAVNAISASFLPVGTYNITASWAVSSSMARTASYIDAANITTGTLSNSRLPAQISVTGITASFTGSLTGSLLGTSSWAQSASNAVNAISASFLPVGTYNITSSWAQSASNAINAISASFLPVGTYNITSSWAQSASNALSVASISNRIVGNVDNRVLTATGGGDINGEANLTFDGTLLTVAGNLLVQGTASFQNTENLLVADKFILLNSGSIAPGPGGIVVQQATQNVGEVLAWDNGSTRWAVTNSFASNQSSFTPNAYVAMVFSASATSPNTTSPPARYNAVGNIYVSVDESIWIYS